MPVTAHKKQFIISRNHQGVGTDWNSFALPDGFILNYQNDLRLNKFEFKGRSVLVLGEIYCVAPAATRDELIENASGRFAVIDWPLLIPDACNLLGIFYGQTADTPVYTSSPALAAREMGTGLSERTLDWKKGMNWFPAPMSRVVGLRRLLLDQAIHIPTGTIQHFQRAFRPMESETGAVDFLGHGLRSVVKQASERHDHLYLALTAGLDSRTLFSALLAEGIKFDAITQKFPETKRNDIEVARQICAKFGIRHHVVTPEEHRPDIAAAWHNHTLDSYCDADNLRLIPCNQYRFLGPNDVLLRGGIFELGRRILKRYVFSRLPEPEALTGNILWRFFEPDGFDAAAVASMDEWLSWRRGHDIGLDLIDAFFIDQRVGGWLAAIEQSLDMLDGTSLQPANCPAFYSALLTGDPVDRTNGSIQKAVIRQIDPDLLKIPINPEPLTVTTRKALGRIKRKIQDSVEQAILRPATTETRPLPGPRLGIGIKS
jgi:hypothetical protein